MIPGAVSVLILNILGKYMMNFDVSFIALAKHFMMYYVWINFIAKSKKYLVLLG